MVFGCDYDDTLVDLAPDAVDFHNRKYGTYFKVEDMKEYNFEKLFGYSRQAGREFVDEYLDSENFKNLKPSLEVVEAVRRIAKISGSGNVITSRHDRFREFTKIRVAEDFRFDGKYAFMGVYFAKNSHTGQCQNRMTKDEACKYFCADFMIDDDLVYAIKCAEREIRVFLINQPWNQANHLPSKIIRVPSMTAVADFVESRGGKP